MTVTRESVRETFSHGTAIADLFKSAFGQIKLFYIEENGQTIGRKPEGKGVKLNEIEIYGDAYTAKGMAREKKKRKAKK